MSETYQNTTQYVYLDVFGGTLDAPPVVTCTPPVGEPRNIIPNTDVPVEGAEERHVAILNLADTQNAGELRVDWEFSIGGQEASKTDYFDVVVPLVEIDDIRSNLELSTLEFSDEKIVNAERRARIQIENATGQKFETTKETLYAVGSGDRRLRLPKRLVSLDGIGILREGYPFNSANFRIAQNGYALVYEPAFLGSEIIVAGGVPITDPYSTINKVWRGGKEIPVTGTWGWQRVPKDVAEAAIILIEANLCADSLYRERYISRMTAADWSMQFDAEAYSGTGNVVVDQILAPYQANNMAVV